VARLEKKRGKGKALGILFSSSSSLSRLASSAFMPPY
jgi:hypothetical protein